MIIIVMRGDKKEHVISVDNGAKKIGKKDKEKDKLKIS